jgi:hypothetical protein
MITFHLNMYLIRTVQFVGLAFEQIETKFFFYNSQLCAHGDQWQDTSSSQKLM